MTKKSRGELLIVESPAKAKTIGKYLGEEYQVMASVGHVRDLPKSNKNAIDVAGGFIPRYEIIRGKEKIVSDLRNAGQNAEQIFLATDPDREGEAIAWHLKESAQLKHPRRIVFHEITKEAITEALKHPRDIDKNLRAAQEARRVLDRLFGYDLSGLIWQKLRYGLSAGRVQSPALRIIVEREKEIRSFIPEKYWVIEARLKTSDGEEIIFTCTEEPRDEATAEKIVMAGRQNDWLINEIKENEFKREPRAPFTTSTLQQTASTRYGFSPAQTMRLAQKLYEAGLITYMRTDSTNLSTAAVREIIALIKKDYGEDYTSGTLIYHTKSKNAQEAHEAIRPTKIEIRRAGGDGRERQLYELVWRRAVASQMSTAKTLKTTAVAKIQNSDCPDFSASGQRIIFDGWLKADPAARGEETELPKMRSGDHLTLVDVQSIGKQTEPPRRFTEAGLIKELERRGLGRPSTYATIVKTIVDRGYVEKINRSLGATPTGEVVSDFLTEHFKNYVSDDFTANMENELDDIAAGKLDYVVSLKKFYGPFQEAVAAKKKMPKISNLGAAPKEFVCPVCGGDMIYKLGKNGRFMSCQRFPDCAGARTESGEKMEGPKETGELCPECGGQLVERTGRYGSFIACANYPKCKYVKRDEKTSSANDTKIACPICNQGTMVEKRGRYGLFYGCSNYPNCKHIIKNRPTGKICGHQRESGPCPHLMMEGTKTIPDRCSDKTCPNHNPHKLERTK